MTAVLAVIDRYSGVVGSRAGLGEGPDFACEDHGSKTISTRAWLR